MRLRLLTLAAVAMVAFYGGVIVDAARTPDDSIALPDVLPTTIPTVPRSTVHVFYTSTTGESHADPVLTAAAIGAIVGAAFLLARLVVVVARRARTARHA